MAGDGALEDYVRLLSRMSSLKDKTFTDKLFRNATAEARKLFGSKEFQKILDGHFAEEYGPLSKQVENELKRKENHAPQEPGAPDRREKAPASR